MGTDRETMEKIKALTTRLYKSMEIGWTVYLLECADGLYVTGLTRDLAKELKRICDKRPGIIFKKHPERFPIKLVIKDPHLTFKEAFAKYCYLQMMDRPTKQRFIKTRIWPVGGPLWEYILTTPFKNLT